jgi:AP-3 complex subunit mu
VNPLFAFAFLNSFLETLAEYLGEVTEATIKENFDIVYMVSFPTFLRHDWHS